MSSKVPSKMLTSDPDHDLERRLRFFQAWERLINKISPQICHVIDLDNFLKATVSEVGKLMGVDRCNLMVYSSEKTLKIDYEYLRNTRLPSALGQEIPISKEFLLDSSYSSEPFFVNDVAMEKIHPMVKDLCSIFGTRSLLIVPIGFKNQLLAVIGLHHSRDVHYWQDDELSFMKSLSNQLAIAYQYMRFYVEKEREVKISHMLLNLVDELYKKENIDEIMRFLLNSLLDIVPAAKAGFGFFDLQGSRINFTTWQNGKNNTRTSAPEFLELSKETKVFEELNSARYIYVKDDSIFLHEGYRLRKAFDCDAILMMPLLVQKSLFGVITFLWDEMKDVPEDDFMLLESILKQVILYFERNQLNSEILLLKQRLREARSSRWLVGDSPTFQQVIEKALSWAHLDISVAIIGEKGTGRTLLAELIHHNSMRENAQFRKIRCRHLSVEQFRELVFGRVLQDENKGVVKISGTLDHTSGGTVFFHEVNYLPIECQVELLEFIENGFYYPEGGSTKIFNTQRLLFSVTEPLEFNKIDTGFWNEISVHSLKLPPLRDRLDDISILATFFIEEIRKKGFSFITGIDHSALDTLSHYSWPGNIRQLKHVIEKAATHCTTGIITSDDLVQVFPLLTNKNRKPEQLVFQVGRSLAELEREVILKTLKAYGGDKQKSAQVLKIGRKTLYRKLKLYENKQK